MKSNSFFGRTVYGVAVLGLAAGTGCWSGINTALAQTQYAQAATAVSPGLDEIVKLTRAQMTDDVIINFIKSSGTQYSLTADDLVYLKTQGVSQPVISTLLQTRGSSAPAAQPPAPAYGQQPPVAPPPPTQPPADYQPPPPAYQPDGSQPPPAPADAAPAPEVTAVNFDYFHDQLQPFGVWESMPGYGWVWFPSEAAVNPDWRPYSDQGHWAYSDQGWLWQSDYPWGDVVFHYGRWTRAVDGRWAWVPAYDWAPAWVAWRHAEAEGCVGWAPLPPAAEFRVGVGLTWGGRVALDADFGLGADFFTFVAFDHFWDHDFRRFEFDRDRVRFFYGRSIIRNGYHFDHGRFIVEGIGHERMAELTHHEVRVIRAEDFRRNEVHRDIVRREEMHPELRRVNLEREQRVGYVRPVERVGERPMDRVGEHPLDKAVERPIDRPGDAYGRPGETTTKPGYGALGNYGKGTPQGKSNNQNQNNSKDDSKDKQPR